MPPISKTEMENKIKELEDKQTELQKEIDELKQAKVEEPVRKRWKPEMYKMYCFIGSDGNTCNSCWHNDILDEWRHLIDNVFETEREAEEYKKKLEIQAKFKNFVEERNDELNWTDMKQNKYFLYYDYVTYELGYAYNNSHKHQGTIYASSEQILEDAIKEIGEENVKKYILEVE